MSDHEEACHREASVAVTHVGDYFTQLRDRLEELALEHDDEQAAEAWQAAEDAQSRLDAALAEARTALEDGDRDE